MRIADTSRPVVVLRPNHQGSIGIMRSLGRLGVRMYGVLDDPWSPPLRSRYCRGVFRWNFDKNPAERSVEFLLEVAKQLGGQPIVLPNGDLTALIVAQHADMLKRAYLFPDQPRGLAEALYSKKGMYLLCKQHGVPSPETAFPQSRTDVLEFLERGAGFPIMLKPIDAHRFRARTGVRLMLVHNRQELLENYDKMEDPAKPNLMLQEYIPGGDDSIWMFNAYFNAQSDCLASFTGQKLRQFPAYGGMTSLGVCVKNETVDQMTREFLKKLGYRGIVDLGYRYDARDRKYKLLDVNPRIGATFRLFVDKNGLDVLRAMYLDLTGQPVPPPAEYEGRKWIVETNDLLALRHYRADGHMTLRDWLRSLGGVQEGAWFAWDDPAPFVLVAADFLRYSFGWLGKRFRIISPKVPERSAVPD